MKKEIESLEKELNEKAEFYKALYKTGKITEEELGIELSHLAGLMGC